MSAAPPPLSLLCLSHLVWERHLFQRPQQLMTQFEALGDRVHYLSVMGFRRWIKGTDERTLPIGARGTARNLPFVPLSKRFIPARRLTDAIVGRLARQFLATTPPGRRVLWLQHPSFLRQVPALQRHPGFDLLVFDRMDPFLAFSVTSPDLPRQEEHLLRAADLVFSGGRSMHRQREGLNPRMHCFPSGIDIAHFARGAEPGPVPQDLAALPPGPRLGYFGAVDERIDWDLIGALCRARPDWQIVFLGPLVLMDRVPLDLPNFHYLGPKRYDVLPDYLRGFHVCLIPWKVNELTRFMSPTKTPEYLAAGRPVVSVPIPDVEADYAGEVAIAATAPDYIAACEEALRHGVGSSRKPPAARTWRETAESMRALMEERLSEKAAVP